MGDTDRGRGRAGLPLALAVLAIAGATGCGDVVVDPEPSGDGAGIDGGADEPGAGADAGVASPCAPGGDPTYDEAWDCVLDAICRQFAACLVPIDRVDCRRMVFNVFFGESSSIEIERIREAIEHGKVIYHPDRVADCVTELDAIECNGGAPFSTLCPIVSGTVPDGEACFASVECETPGAQCGSPEPCGEVDLCCARTCVPPAPLRASCGGDTPCQAGSYCVAGTCHSGEPGSKCEKSDHCDLPFWCDGGTCQPDAAAGGDCTVNEQCPPPQTCVVAPPSLAGVCGRIDRVGDSCDEFCYGLFCRGLSETELGICVEYAGEGESCGDRLCLASFRCDPRTSRCVSRADVGDPCAPAANQCRFGLFCDTELDPAAREGRCLAPQPEGAPCTSAGQCQSGLCDPTTMRCQDFPGCYPGLMEGSPAMPGSAPRRGPPR